MPIDETRRFLPVRIAVLTVSDTRSLADDRSGDTLVGILGAGNTVELAGGTLQLTSDSGEETKFEGAAIRNRYS